MPKRRDPNPPVVYCYDCATDIRLANLKYHRELGHRLRESDKDPRDQRKENKK